MYQFHDQKALFKVPKICNIIFWIENDTFPKTALSENSSDLVAGPFPEGDEGSEEADCVEGGEVAEGADETDVVAIHILSFG